MKSKHIASILFLACLLTSCSNTNRHPISGGGINKVVFKYNLAAEVVTLTADEIYEKVITNKENLAAFYSVDGCPVCAELEKDMLSYAYTYHTDIYKVDLTRITRSDYQKLVDMTKFINETSPYKFPDWQVDDTTFKLDVPILQIYAYQGVVIQLNDRFVDGLLKYTTVEQPLD